MYSDAHGSTIYNSQDIDATNRWRDKIVVVQYVK